MRTDRKNPAPDRRTERMLSYLDGTLSAVEREAYEAKLAADPAQAREVDSHRALVATLGEMAAYAPSSDFRVRVLAFLNTHESWWVRLRRKLFGTPPAMSNVFAAFLDEGLTTRQARALAAFVARDPEAAAALAGWERLFGELGTLPGFEPSEGFADRVMARLSVRGQQQVAPPASARAGSRRLAGIMGLPAAARYRERATAWIDARWPTPRDRFAVTSGMAVGPVAVFFVALHMLSSNPLLTTSNVASFLRTRVGGAASQLTDAVSGNPTADYAMGRVSGLLDTWTLSGPTLAAGLILFGALTFLSAWILYRNVVKLSRSENRYVSV